MSATPSPVTRPRLSLQIKAISNGPGVRASRTLASTVDPKSPTAFNTLSNVYVSAIDRSTQSQADPVTAVNLSSKPRLHVQTQCDAVKERRLNTPFGGVNTPYVGVNTPYVGAFPETPLTAQPLSPAVAMEIAFPGTMAATPPLSAGPVEPGVSVSFAGDPAGFPSASAATLATKADWTPQRRTTFPLMSANARLAPYSHPRSLHSILRNSPLPPPSAKTPVSPRRQSLRLQEKAARRVGYNSPLTQTITTNTYTRSHIDLLCDDMSPFSPPSAMEDAVMTPATAFESYETRDGGETPGPFEEMRRRMAGLGTSTPISPAANGGVRKRKKKDKKRRWVWTIGQEDDEEGGGGGVGGGGGGAAPSSKAAQVAAAIREVRNPPDIATPVAQPRKTTAYPPPVVEPPTPSVESSTGLDSIFEGAMDDVAMSETTSISSDLNDRERSPVDMDLDLETPIATRKPIGGGSETGRRDRLGSVDLFNAETGSRRDTPVPDYIAENDSCA